MSERFRKRFEKIDEKVLEKLCQLQCSIDEIADFFGVDKAQIERYVIEKYNMTFADYWRWKSTQGKIALKSAQYQEALAGNTQMLIYLGKVLLGQREGLGDVKIQFEIVTREKKEEQKDENSKSEGD